MSTIAQTRLSNATLLRAGGAGVLAAVAANVVVRLILGAIVPLSPDFMPFTLGPIIAFTLLFTLIGVGVLAIVNRVAANPLRTYNIIGVIAFLCRSFRTWLALPIRHQCRWVEQEAITLF